MIRTSLAAALLALLALTSLRPPAAAAVPAGVPLAWGWNDHGALGNGTLTNSAVPVPVSNLSNVVAADAGAIHSMALKANGTVFTWGDNTQGQLGIGTFGGVFTTPVQVSGLTGVIAIAACYDNSLALKAD